MNIQKTDKPTLYYMVGLPGSGKSTIAQELAQKNNAFIHSSDLIREEYNNEICNQKVFNILHKRIKQDLMDGKNCIYDATNIYSKRRIAFLRGLNRIPCRKECILVALPYEKCLENNKNRDRKVPDEVIERMYKSFHIPYWYEGWDDIHIEYNGYEGTNGFPIRVINKYIDFNQDNSHHELTLGEHLKQTLLYIQSEQNLNKTNPKDILLRQSAVLHDCGKPFVKDFHNAKGEPSKNAHYYNHQYVGAYESLFYHMGFSKPLDVAVRVMWHMHPYFWERDNNFKMQKKYYYLWGEELYNDIMLLHEADVHAHNDCVSISW